MSKLEIDKQIRLLKTKSLVQKVLPWTEEGGGQDEFFVRYVGLSIPQDLQSIISQANHLLVRFKTNRKYTIAEVYLANTPPFTKITDIFIKKDTDWFEKFKKDLKQDHQDYTKGQTKLNNLYQKIKNHLKK